MRAAKQWHYTCDGCGAKYPFYQELCEDCREPISAKVITMRPGKRERSIRASELTPKPIRRVRTNRPAWDKVLGGGFALPSSCLVFGEAGIMKTTLILAISSHIAKELGGDVLFGESEMTRDMVLSSAIRIGADLENLIIYDGNDAEEFFDEADRLEPKVLVLDSIQGFAPESDVELERLVKSSIEYARNQKSLLFLISQISKKGDFLGGNHIRHDVDASIKLARDQADRRVVEVRKHRYGPAPLREVDE